MLRESAKARGGKYIRLGSLLLMLIFAVCSFTLMWTAVGCFKRIRSGYESASESLAAARFTANRLRGAAGGISVYYLPDGTLDKMVINSGDGFEDVVTYKGGRLYEAFVHEGSSMLGEELFPVKSMKVEASDTGTVRISAGDPDERTGMIYVMPAGDISFYPSEGGGE